MNDDTIKLAVLENEVKNVGLQLERLNSHIESEQRTRYEVNKLMLEKFDALKDKIVTHDEFEGLKKKSIFSIVNTNGKSNDSKSSRGARLGRWDFWLSLFGGWLIK